MKKRLILLTLFLILLSGLALADTCIDKDGDNVYSASGIIIYDNNGNFKEFKEDTCNMDTSTVFEQTCQGGFSYVCETSCVSGGKCEQLGGGSYAPRVSTCTDSDKGINEFAKGYISYGAGEEITSPENFIQDTCVNQKTVLERSCQGDQLITCQNACVDGQCTHKEVPTSNVQCIDKDVGENDIYTKATVTTILGEGTEAIRIDACIDSRRVWEQDCSPEGGRAVTCLEGCEDGACFKPYTSSYTASVVQEVEGRDYSKYILFIILGALAGIIYSLRRIFALEVRIKAIDEKIERLLVKLLGKKALPKKVKRKGKR